MVDQEKPLVNLEEMSIIERGVAIAYYNRHFRAYYRQEFTDFYKNEKRAGHVKAIMKFASEVTAEIEKLTLAVKIEDE
jgi:hypothetical protein